MYRQCFSTLIFFRYRRPYLDGDWISLNSHIEKNIHLFLLLPSLSLSLSLSLSSLFVRNRYLVDAAGKIIPRRTCVSNASTYERTNIVPTQIYSDSSIAAANERFHRANENLRARNGGLYRLAFAKSTFSTKELGKSSGISISVPILFFALRDPFQLHTDSLTNCVASIWIVFLIFSNRLSSKTFSESSFPISSRFCDKS